MAETRYGYCECGCGQKTKLAAQTQASRGTVKGEPQRFVRGHGNARKGPAPICSEEGCEREVLARGLCRMHYQREAKKTDPERFRDYQRKWIAKPENRERKNASKRAAYRRDPEKHIKAARETIVRRQYGITIEEYEAILARGCAICGSKRRGVGGLALDHCHATNTNRDALCGSCNNGLGRFKDDPDLLRRAASYVETHRQPLTQMKLA